MSKKKKGKPVVGRHGLTRGLTFQEVKPVPYKEFKSGLSFKGSRFKIN